MSSISPSAASACKFQDSLVAGMVACNIDIGAVIINPQGEKNEN